MLIKNVAQGLMMGKKWFWGPYRPNNRKIPYIPYVRVPMSGIPDYSCLSAALPSAFINGSISNTHL